MGRTIAIGDVHGCAREFEKLLKKLKPQKSDRIIQLGDLINKGPDSHEAIELARAHDIQTIMGNHEMRLLRAKEEKNFKLFKFIFFFLNSFFTKGTALFISWIKLFL